MMRQPADRRRRTRPVRSASPYRGNMPPLNLVRAFEAAARTGTMRRAAEDIGISHTVISRHIRDLEAWLRVKLVIAGPRGIKLTRRGESFSTAIARAFGLILAATAELRPTARRRMLRIWCMPGLATRWLTPRLALVQQALPEMELLLRATDQLPDFTADAADLVIGFRDLDAIPKGAETLVQPRMFPVASPQWLKRRGAPRSVRLLANSPLIHEDSRQQWTDWFEAAGITPAKGLSGPRLSDASLAFDAALAGLGVALATRLTAQSEIAGGRLVELFNTNIKLGAYYFLAAPLLRKDPAISRFRDWLIAHLLATENPTALQ